MSTQRTEGIINFDTMMEDIKDEEVTTKQLFNYFKDLQYGLKISKNQILKLKKEIELRPTCSSLTENTILTATAIHTDPSIVKLLTTKEHNFDPNSDSDSEAQSKRIDHHKQLKTSSEKLGYKISQISEALPILLSLIRSLEKKSNSESSELKSLIEQKTASLQQQLGEFKDEQISERLELNQKIELTNSDCTERIRQFETQINWQIKEFKVKLEDRVTKDAFAKQIQSVIDRGDNKMKKFQEESVSLVNPEKIKEIEAVIAENKEQLLRDLSECDLKISVINKSLSTEVVKFPFYDKERVNIEKRISTIDDNFQQFFAKVNSLSTASENHGGRVTALEKKGEQTEENLVNMRTILNHLHITEEFQKMLSRIDPQKILELEDKIQSLQYENVAVYKEIGNVNRDIDKLQAKMNVGGVMIPNQERQKLNHRQDIIEAIDSYFIENRFAQKINTIQNDLNEYKSTTQTVTLLKKSIARYQKETDVGSVSHRIVTVEAEMESRLSKVWKKIKELETVPTITLPLEKDDKLKTFVSQKERNPLRHHELLSTGNAEKRRESLLEQPSELLRHRNSSYTSHKSLRKLTADNGNRGQKYEAVASYHKNTASSNRKNLLKSNELLTHK